ncbi:MAG: D-alanyl-D-alanine carboxypeptidase family protein [Thermoleophilia bacterium]|nr:D-alanyl-D-alanine carboxypeptidase family protein [Thermoleophilia bacterium]
MGCGATPPISQLPPGTVSTPGGASAAPPASVSATPPTASSPPAVGAPPIGAQPAPPALATSSPAVDAVAGASGGGPLASQGAIGGALAGATGAVSVDQLVASIKDIVARLTALVEQLKANSDLGGANAAPTADASGKLTGGGATGSPGGGGCCGGASDAQGGVDPTRAGNAAQVGQRTLDRVKHPTNTGGASGAPTLSQAANTSAAGAPPGPGANAGKIDSALVAKWVTGDSKGLNPQLLNKLAQVGEKLGKAVKIDSGKRSREEQQHLYNAYLAGTGNLAAKPGSSNHESGNAADVKVGGVSLRNNAEGAAFAKSIGLTFPVPSEAWHIELAK